MLKAFVLILSFQDGYLGGTVTGAYFDDMAQCQKKGAEIALQYSGYGHPTTFFCTKTPDNKKHGGTVTKYNTPTEVMP